MASDQRPLVVVVNWRDLEHPDGGGAEVMCDEMAAALVDAEHDVVLLCAKVKGRPREEVRRGYTIHRAGGRFTVYARALAWLLVHRSRVDLVVDSQNGIPFFSPIVLRRQTPLLLLIYHIHQEQFSAYFPRPIAAIGRWLETSGSRLVYRRRMVVAISPSTRRGVRQDLKLMGEIRVIPPGSRTAGQADRFAIRDVSPKIVSVGRLVPHKRTRLVVEAMADVRRAVPNVSLDIIGSGPELATLRRLVNELHLEDVVHFYPSCSNERRDELVSSAWLSINASAGEGWGISVVESNALGIPVLAFDRPGLRDSIRDGETGWLIEEGSPLSSAIPKAVGELRDLDVAAEFARRARDWASGFTWDEAGHKLRVAALVERRRMALNHPDRRVLSDVGTVVQIAGDFADSWSPQLRIGDTLSRNAAGWRMFLASADTAGALTVLARCGLPDGASDDDVTVRVARGSDYLMPLAVQLKPTREIHSPPGSR